MKKLIPAISMLLVAACLLGSSTFAWFSMNTNVTATGMQVTAKSDSTYLLISDSKTTAAEIQTENNTTVALTISDEASKVFPSAPATTDPEVGYLTTSGKDVDGATITTAGVKVTNRETANAVTNWYTANAQASNASTIKTETARQLKDFNGYVIKKTVYLTVAKGSNAANNLTVTPTFAQKASGTDITAARVLVATSDGGFIILDKNDNGTKVDIKGTNTSLTDATVVTVDLYIYYDGNDSEVYTNNAANLTGATVNLSFDVAVVPAA